MDSERPAGMRDEAIERRVERLLAESAHADNPLRGCLAELLDLSRAQRERLERIIRISDGYHDLSHSSTLSIVERCDKQLRRIERLARISDRYQEALRDLSESLKEAAERDLLTGLGNRRFLTQRIKEEIARAERQHSHLSFAILDVDHFKQINDRFGHEHGDRILTEIATTIRNALRNYDVCGRWGGEEFLIILPDTDLTTAIETIERVRRQIAAMRACAEDDRPEIAISASFGIAQFRDGESFSDALNRADAALYRAKRRGRNRVECA